MTEDNDKSHLPLFLRVPEAKHLLQGFAPDPASPLPRRDQWRTWARTTLEGHGFRFDPGEAPANEDPLSRVLYPLTMLAQPASASRKGGGWDCAQWH